MSIITNKNLIYIYSMLIITKILIMTLKIKIYALYAVSFLLFIFGLIELIGATQENDEQNLGPFITSLKILTFIVGLLDIAHFIFYAAFFHTTNLRMYNSIVDLLNANGYFNASIIFILLRLIFNFVLYLIIFFLITIYHPEFIELGSINKILQVTSVINYIFGCVISILTMLLIIYTCYQTSKNKKNKYKLVFNNNRIEIIDQNNINQNRVGDNKTTKSNTDEELERLLVDSRYQDSKYTNP